MHKVAKSNANAKRIFPIIARYAPRDHVLALLDSKNMKGEYPEDLAVDAVRFANVFPGKLNFKLITILGHRMSL